MDPVNVKIMLGFMKEQKLQKLETLIREYENRSPICHEECGKLKIILYRHYQTENTYCQMRF